MKNVLVCIFALQHAQKCMGKVGLEPAISRIIIRNFQNVFKKLEKKRILQR